MKKILIGIGIVLIVFGGWYLLRVQSKAGPDPAGMRDSVSDSDPWMEEGENIAYVITTASQIVDNPNTRIATLVDVSGGQSSGEGYILRDAGTTYHYVQATLPVLQGDEAYEGWMVKREPELIFFSTGVMQRSEDSQYELSFETDVDTQGYDFVVITRETVVDDTPETHIIEGEAV